MDSKLSKFREHFSMVISLIIITVVIYVAYNGNNNERGWTKFYEIIKQDEYYGTVTKKYVDSKDHAIEKVVLDNVKTIKLIDDYWYRNFELGDFVYKKRGSLEIFLIKQSGDTLVFDYRDIEI